MATQQATPSERQLEIMLGGMKARSRGHQEKNTSEEETEAVRQYASFHREGKRGIYFKASSR